MDRIDFVSVKVTQGRLYLLLPNVMAVIDDGRSLSLLSPAGKTLELDAGTAIDALRQYLKMRSTVIDHLGVQAETQEAIHG